MQITSDKCQDGVDCSDPDFNIKTGAYYLKSLIDNSGGNVIKALGQYNGWEAGSMSVNSATAAAYSECCQVSSFQICESRNNLAANVFFVSYSFSDSLDYIVPKQLRLYLSTS